MRYYKARLVLNEKREPFISVQARMPKSVVLAMRAFCREHDIRQQDFMTEAVKEVLDRLEKELAAPPS